METSLVQTVRYSTLVETTSISAAPTPTTVSVPGSTVTLEGTTDFRTSVLPAPTPFVTKDTSSSPPQTVTAAVETVTVPSSTQVVTVPEDQEMIKVPEPAQPTVASALAETVTQPGSTSTETTTAQILSTCAVTLAPSATGAPPAPEYYCRRI